MIAFVDVPLNEYDIFFHVELFNPSLAQNDFHQIVPRACVLFTTRSKLLAVPSLTYIPTVYSTHDVTENVLYKSRQVGDRFNVCAVLVPSGARAELFVYVQ